MKKFLTLCLSFFAFTAIGHAQSLIYSQNFNSGSAPEWTLNSTVTLESGITGTDLAPTGNEWLINNKYTAGFLGTTTPSEPAGITGSPTSYYLHMNCGTSESAFYGLNDNYLAGSTMQVYIAQMTTAQVTTGFTNVYFSFWWLCLGDATGDEGNLYYSTNGGTTWTQITGVNFYGSSTWEVDSLHLAAFDNQASLEFAFTFTDADAGATDPEFGIDDISLYGTPSGTAPTASFTSSGSETTCQDSCMLFTSTSTGTITGLSWTATGAIVENPTSDTTTICFPSAGTYSVTLTATNGSGSNSATSAINVTPTPSPVITNTGGVLSVPSVYTTYQWYDGLTAISGATTNTYTVTTTGTYGIVVDSAGCIGLDTLTASPSTGIANVSSSTTNYWLAQPNNSSLAINASTPLSDALNINIYDETGREILNGIWNAGSNTKQINGLSLTPGLYIIKISNNYTSKVLKWLKP